ncbi:hypothetical protein HXA35_15720 [Bacillus sp. A301a_S52]|nr:hypothetical protein [Bacillus sp. A301a_S52]
MMRTIIILILGIVTLSLVACQQNELFDETITSIKVEQWESDEEMSTITDESLINDLTAELESANTASTANIDITHPDYRLLFLNGDRVVRELGYYSEEKNFNGTTGRFIDMDEGKHYGVTTELPLNNNNE